MSSDTPGRGHAARNLALLREADGAGIDVNAENRRETVADLLEEHADELDDLTADLPDARAVALAEAARMLRVVAACHRDGDDTVRDRLVKAPSNDDDTIAFLELGLFGCEDCGLHFASRAALGGHRKTCEGAETDRRSGGQR
jgi:hypothetical protein